jgi:hypothetical protein
LLSPQVYHLLKYGEKRYYEEKNSDRKDDE